MKKGNVFQRQLETVRSNVVVIKQFEEKQKGTADDVNEANINLAKISKDLIPILDQLAVAGFLTIHAATVSQNRASGTLEKNVADDCTINLEILTADEVHHGIQLTVRADLSPRGSESTT